MIFQQLGQALITHQNSIHKGKKYLCKQCDYQATRRDSLVTHQQSVHIGRKYPCADCDYQATTKGHLVSHQQSVHMERTYPCQQCDYQATRKDSLVRHQQSVHQQSVHSAHQGVTGMTLRAERSVFWPGITNDIQVTRDRCLTCHKNAPSQAKLLADSPRQESTKWMYRVENQRTSRHEIQHIS